ncbi:diguanylate cyclase [Vibrio parahaemolyticus]|uniref:TackOD1 domain-containing metal-binding protein n=1 Tax=Vibrio parahaemolyticus TaxID=670 RepID=UPI002B1ED210|nr:diguanylate cyclase [Vibrio parahaemolyticus]MEA5312908.1 diguanylate cyclase [Vibrio parahaemolyticus]
MSLKNKSFYWVGEPPTSNFCEGVILVNQIEEVPVGLGGMVCISYSDTQQINHALKAFFKEKGRWSWAVYVTVETPYSRCIADGVFEEVESKKVWRSIQSKIDSIDEPDVLDPLIGWLGVNRQRRVRALKSLESTSIYSFPIIDLLFPDIYSTYRYVLSEQGRGVLEPEALIDRIRVCSHCNSGHLNYVEVCPDCSSIDIDSQSSLHCFTCGHVGEQHSFQRRGKLECPKCLTQLRHIGVDYDRPLENHVCHSCSSLFVEAATISQCLSCDSKIKVEVSFFQNLLAWLNKVALRHKEQHLLLGLHLPTIDEYGKQYGDAKLFSLMDQLTRRLSGLFRDTDICCQYKQDVLLVLMPNTTNASLSVLQQKLSDLGDLVEDEEFELDVFAWDLPDPVIEGGVSVWIESLMGEIYAAR